jgi:hypothetical protein
MFAGFGVERGIEVIVVSALVRNFRRTWLKHWLASVYFSLTRVGSALARKLLRSTLEERIISSLTLVSGTFDSSKISLFAIVKNEIVLLPAFLAHHRSIGVEQFLVAVDYSDDGTLEFLTAQDDVVVLSSEIRFSDQINISLLDRFGFSREDHASKTLKEVITQHYFYGTFGLYLDADEFLFLPPSVSSIRELIQVMTKENLKSMVASVVEFFPASAEDLRKKTAFDSLESLLASYPFFENQKLLKARKGCFAEEVNPAKTNELFADFLGEEGISVRLKTPIVFHDSFSFRVGAHVSSLPPSSKHMLTIAHFKFTWDSFSKFREVIESRSHPPNSNRKYDLLYELLRVMDSQSASFLSDRSVAFESTEQFLSSGLMVWPQGA